MSSKILAALVFGACIDRMHPSDAWKLSYAGSGSLLYSLQAVESSLGSTLVTI